MKGGLHGGMRPQKRGAQCPAGAPSAAAPRAHAQPAAHAPRPATPRAVPAAGLSATGCRVSQNQLRPRYARAAKGAQTSGAAGAARAAASPYPALPAGAALQPSACTAPAQPRLTWRASRYTLAFSVTDPGLRIALIGQRYEASNNSGNRRRGFCGLCVRGAAGGTGL